MIDANHYHIFWSCPVLTPFWQEIHKHISNIFGANIPFNCKTFYMGDFFSDGGTINDKKLVQILLAASKKAITRKWLKPHCPTIDDWIEIIYQIYILERLSYSLKVQKEQFSKICSK